MPIQIGFNAEPDTDPAFFVNADPDTYPDPNPDPERIQITRFWCTKNSENFTAEIILIFP